MKQTIVYVGLDVDDTQYHGSALAKTTGEGIDFTCAWRITNRHFQSALPGGLIFSSTILTLSGHEEYVHGFHLPRVPNPQTPQTWRHEGLDCRKPPAEATAVTHHSLAKTRAQSLTSRSVPPWPLDHLS